MGTKSDKLALCIRCVVLGSGRTTFKAFLGVILIRSLTVFSLFVFSCLCRFVTYNYLDLYMPWNHGTPMQKVCRNAFIGIAASFVSDVSSNGIRVLKTYRQTYPEPIGESCMSNVAVFSLVFSSSVLQTSWTFALFFFITLMPLLHFLL